MSIWAGKNCGAAVNLFLGHLTQGGEHEVSFFIYTESDLNSLSETNTKYESNNGEHNFQRYVTYWAIYPEQVKSLKAILMHLAATAAV